MTSSFNNLMREQVQEKLNQFSPLIHQQPPHGIGWLKTIRLALGMPSKFLAKLLKSSPANVTDIERRERLGTISLKTLENTAAAMNCRLVYCIVPLKPLNEILEDQARKVARKMIREINHSMKLEDQGLTAKQLKNQEDDLVAKLLQENTKFIWKQELSNAANV